LLDRYRVDIPQRAVQSFYEVGKYLKYKGKKELVEPRGLEPLTSTCCNFIPQMKICCSVSLWASCDSRRARAAERRLEFLASLESGTSGGEISRGLVEPRGSRGYNAPQCLGYLGNLG
jgi:hypothetical protein